MFYPFELKPYLFPRGQAGLCCDEEGVALRPVALVEKSNAISGKRYRICSPEVFVKAFVAAYGRPPFELVQYLWEGIGRVMKSLEDGDLPLAAIKAIHLTFPEIEAENMAKLEACEIEKQCHDHDVGDGQFTWLGGTAKSAPLPSAEATQNACNLEIALTDYINLKKYNHNHDPTTGQFTYASGGSDGAQAGEKRPKLLHKQSAFFDKMYAPIHKLSKQYDFNEDSLLALSAHESGWLESHNSKLNNPFGVTFAGGPNQSFSSIDAAVKYWGDHYGDIVRGTKTIGEFLDKLGHTPNGAYNSADKEYDNHVEDMARNIGQHKSDWLREQKNNEKAK